MGRQAVATLTKIKRKRVIRAASRTGPVRLLLAKAGCEEKN